MLYGSNNYKAAIFPDGIFVFKAAAQPDGRLQDVRCWKPIQEFRLQARPLKGRTVLLKLRRCFMGLLYHAFLDMVYRKVAGLVNAPENSFGNRIGPQDKPQHGGIAAKVKNRIENRYIRSSFLGNTGDKIGRFVAGGTVYQISAVDLIHVLKVLRSVMFHSRQRFY